MTEKKVWKQERPTNNGPVEDHEVGSRFNGGLRDGQGDIPQSTRIRVL